MSNLQKFNQTLDNLNQEVESLKNVSKVYKKIHGLTVSHNKTIAILQKYNALLERITHIQKDIKKNVFECLSDIENKNQQNKEELNRLLEIRTEQIRFSQKELEKDMSSSLSDII